VPGPHFDPLVATAPEPVARLSQAQVEAFSAFYRAHIERVVTFLRFQGASWEEAADAAQEAMTKAYQSWDSLTRPHAWVRTAATREFIRRRVRLHEDATEQVPEPVTALLRDPPAAATEDAEAERQVQWLLDQLPTRQRQMLAWTYDGYTPTEIAHQLSMADRPVTPAAVRASLMLARRALAHQVGCGEDRP
jgi:RNA polymerase sigma-70 factor (ECF subfamily)